MRVVIFGSAGQVGRALRGTAPDRAEVIALERSDCDVADPKQVRRAIKSARPSLVFNAAAYTGVDKAESEPELAGRINTFAAGSMAAASHEAGARFVHISTDFVFAGTASSPRAPADEASPQGIYARTKFAGEREVVAAHPDALVVRTARVYAPIGRNFVNKMLCLMAERDSVHAVSDQVSTPTYAPSLARALWRLAALGATGVHHYTDAGVASWYDFAVAIAEEGRLAGLVTRPVTVLPVRSADFPTDAPRPFYSVLDKDVTWTLLGSPAPHWRANLRENLAELRANA